jgi:hypothetical protein
MMTAVISAFDAAARAGVGSRSDGARVPRPAASALLARPGEYSTAPASHDAGPRTDQVEHESV